MRGCNYTLKHWEAVKRFIADGTSETDGNLIDNAIRPSALGKKLVVYRQRAVSKPSGGTRTFLNIGNCATITARVRTRRAPRVGGFPVWRSEVTRRQLVACGNLYWVSAVTKLDTIRVGLALSIDIGWIFS